MPVANASKAKRRCELMTNPAKRAAADKLTASVKDSLPVGLSQPTLRALAAAGIKRLDHFTRVTKESLLKLHGVGPKAIPIIDAALKKDGKCFLRAKKP